MVPGHVVSQSQVKPRAGYTCANVNAQDKFTHVVPMLDKTGPEVATTLIEFTDDVGIPDAPVTDGLVESNSGIVHEEANTPSDEDYGEKDYGESFPRSDPKPISGSC